MPTKKTFTKPHVKFPMFPIIFNWIESAYNKVETYEQFTDFVHGCMNEADNTKNDVKKQAYTTVANSLYGIETNVSYESKGLEILVQAL